MKKLNETPIKGIYVCLNQNLGNLVLLYFRQIIDVYALIII